MAFSFTPPLSSGITSRVEKATSHLLSTADWALNMEICDIANNDQGLAKDVVKTIKKRLQNKNPKIQFFTLTLLETLVKNCGDFVHYLLVEREILQEMTKIVKKGADMQVRDKALVLLDSWQEAFGGPGGKYPQYYWAYVELKRAGVTFPRRTTDTPIFTPPAKHPATTLGNSVNINEAMTSERGNFSLLDLNQIQNVMEFLDEMLQAVNPRDREAVKDEVINELVSQCRSNQKRLMEQLSSTGDEEILGKGLQLNDNLQSLLAKYDAITSGAPLPIEASKSPLKQKTPIEPPIVRNQLDEDDEDDDEFAQLARRKTKVNQVSSESTSLNSSDPLSPNHSDVTTPSTSEASSSTASNALVLFDPPPPVRTHKEDQNMIDLLSLTLVTNPSPPHTPVAPPSAPNQQESPSLGQGYIHTSQSYGDSQGYAPHNAYVAPWAQQALPPSQPQPPLQQSSQYTSYAIPPYQSPAYPNSISANSFSGYTANQPQYYNSFNSAAGNVPNAPAAVYQPDYATRPQQYGSFGSGAFHTSTSAPGANQFNYFSQPQPSYNSFSLGTNNVPAAAAVSTNNPNYSLVPIQNFNSFSSSAANTPANANQPVSTASAMQKYNSFGARGAPTVSAEQQMNSNVSQTGTTSSQKPYYHPDSLFNDLIDLRSSGVGQKRPPLTGSSGQSMISGRK